jgi:ribonuclease P protein component
LAVLKKLTKRSDFLRVQRANINHVTPSLVMQIAPGGQIGHDGYRIGFTASKKIGNAIKRNFAKRRMRALILRQWQELIEASDYVLIARQALLINKFSDIEVELISAIHALNKKVLLRKANNKPNSSN